MLAPATISVDHPRYLSFIPGAPSEAAVLFDLVVGASSIYGGSWYEGAGAVYAENQALRWLADLAGFPPEAGGVFVQGGTNGNLSALVAARTTRRAPRPDGPSGGAWPPPTPPTRRCASAARVMDVDVLRVPTAEPRLTRRRARAPRSTRTAPTTSSPSWRPPAARTSASSTTWPASRRWPRSAACGYTSTAPTGSPRWRRPRHARCFDGIERADSFTVDPHKWLFAPFDCCALLYRDPAARPTGAHAEGGVPRGAAGARVPCADYAVQLTRRARGLPFWFSLADIWS